MDAQSSCCKQFQPVSQYLTRWSNKRYSVTGWVFFVQMYYIPTYYRVVYGYTPLKAGYFIIPLTVIEAFSSTVCGIVIAWTGRYRESILIGWALW
jgi:hypothetical protein